MRHSLRVLAIAAVVALCAARGLAQETGTLRVTVALTDATGTPVPLPRVVLLVSDNPATGEPRRIRTEANGTMVVRLKPGSYIVESDEPVGFAGKGYAWTMLVTVAAGKDTLVNFTAANAEIGDAPTPQVRSSAAAQAGDAAMVLSKWRDSVVEIWTPTDHLSGFLVDTTGLILTSFHGIGSATSVEVEMTSGGDRFKVAGQVVASDRLTGAAVVRVAAAALASPKPMDLSCGRTEWPRVEYNQDVTAIIAPMLSEKDSADGPVSKVTSQAIFADLRLKHGDSGGPVFNEGGELIGISALDEDAEGRRAPDPWVVPLQQACTTLADAIKKTAGAEPPSTAHLPIDPGVKDASAKAGATKVQQPPAIPAANFDITLMTPAMALDAAGQNGPRSEFGNWVDYIRRAPPVLIVRVSPQFEESFWRMLARGAAATQGMSLPPLKSFTSNFARLTASCGDTEVRPIHPFVIEHQVPQKTGVIREGLYVFDPASLGPQCTTVRLSMYSEKDPQKADVKTIDGKVLQPLINSLQ